jgi:LacI family transcriptional regulator
MKRLMEVDPRPDGVFGYDDSTAIGAMRAVLKAGLDVPNDVAIIGCGNLTYADFIRVPLTSIDQQDEQIGEGAAKIAMKVLENSPRYPKQVVLQPRLIERASTLRGPIPRPPRSGRTGFSGATVTSAIVLLCGLYGLLYR